MSYNTYAAATPFNVLADYGAYETLSVPRRKPVPFDHSPFESVIKQSQNFHAVDYNKGRTGPKMCGPQKRWKRPINLEALKKKPMPFDNSVFAPIIKRQQNYYHVRGSRLSLKSYTDIAAEEQAAVAELLAREVQEAQLFLPSILKKITAHQTAQSLGLKDRTSQPPFTPGEKAYLALFADLTPDELRAKLLQIQQTMNQAAVPGAVTGPAVATDTAVPGAPVPEVGIVDEGDRDDEAGEVTEEADDPDDDEGFETADDEADEITAEEVTDLLIKTRRTKLFESIEKQELPPRETGSLLSYADQRIESLLLEAEHSLANSGVMGQKEIVDSIFEMTTREVTERIERILMELNDDDERDGVLPEDHDEFEEDEITPDVAREMIETARQQIGLPEFEMFRIRDADYIILPPDITSGKNPQLNALGRNRTERVASLKQIFGGITNPDGSAVTVDVAKNISPKKGRMLVPLVDGRLVYASKSVLTR